MAAWRFRKCPACLAVFPGGELKPLFYGKGSWDRYGNGALRKCPNCGSTGYTREFPVISQQLLQSRERPN
ncbi:MAG: hypothetical protein ACYDHZ_05955 [Dehalococcoidia bacterium]